MHFSPALIAALAALPVAFASPIATASVETSTKRDEFDQCHYGFFTNDENAIQCISPSGQDSASKRDNPENAALCPAGWFVYDGAVHCIPSPELNGGSKRSNKDLENAWLPGGPTPSPTTSSSTDQIVKKDDSQLIQGCENAGCSWLVSLCVCPPSGAKIPSNIKRTNEELENAWLPGGPTPSPAPVKVSNDDQSIDGSTKKRETQNIEMCESAGCIWVGGFHGDVLAGCVCSHANKLDGDVVEKRQSQQIESCENAGCMWTGSPIDDVFGQCICPQATSPTSDIVEKRQSQQIESCENAGCMWTGSPIDDVFGQCICPQAQGATGDKRSIDPSHARLARNSPTSTRKRSDDALPPTWSQGPFGRLYIRDDSASDGGNNWLPPSPTVTTTKRDMTPQQYGKSWMCSVQGLDYDPYLIDGDNPYGSCVIFVDPSTLGGRDNVKAKRSSDDIFHQSTCYTGDFCASIGYHWRDIGGGCGECF